jgi:hypothetical protein
MRIRGTRRNAARRRLRAQLRAHLGKALVTALPPVVGLRLWVAQGAEPGSALAGHGSTILSMIASPIQRYCGVCVRVARGLASAGEADA